MRLVRWRFVIEVGLLYLHPQEASQKETLFGVIFGGIRCVRGGRTPECKGTGFSCCNKQHLFQFALLGWITLIHLVSHSLSRVLPSYVCRVIS